MCGSKRGEPPCADLTQLGDAVFRDQGQSSQGSGSAAQAARRLAAARAQQARMDPCLAVASTGEGNPAGKRARTGDSGGNDVSGDLAVHIASSREEAMAVQGVDVCSASVPSSVVRSAAAGASAAAAPLA